MKTKYPNRHGKNNSNWRGGKLRRKCGVCGKIFLEYPSKVKRGGGKLCNRKCLDSYRSTLISGKNNPSWKGGVTPEIIRQRVSTKYEMWRDEVYKRDNFTCQRCGDSKGGNLNAHHIKGFTAYPELRFLVDNGITLCTTCHKAEHKRKK